MPDTPLNPDALEAASRTVHPGYWKLIDKYPEESVTQKSKSNLIEEARSTVSAYLAAALPEVTSVEELDQLPDRSVVLDADGAACQRNGFGMDGNCWDSMGEEMLSRHIPLPARVLYRPAVKP